MLGSVGCLYAQFRFSACKEPPYPQHNLLPFSFPIPVVGCPPGGSFPHMGKQGWLSLQPWLLLLTPVWLLPLAGALQSLSAAFLASPLCSSVGMHIGILQPSFGLLFNCTEASLSVKAKKEKKLEGSLCTATCSLKRNRDMSESSFLGYTYRRRKNFSLKRKKKVSWE